MALIAAIAVAFAAVMGAVATGGHRIGGSVVTPALYGLGLVPGVVAVAARRTAPAVAVPPKAARVAKVAVLFVALYVFSGRGRPVGVSGLMAVLGLAVIGLSFLWPRPGALRLSLALSVVSLMGPAASTTASAGRGGALVAMAAAAAVALVATNRLATASHRALADVPATSGFRPVRIGGEAAVVAAVLALAGLVSVLFQPPSQAAGTTGSRAGQPAEERPGAPLAFLAQLDPARDGDARSAAGSDGDDVVLRVDARRGDVWRAQTFDRWDGRLWRAAPMPPGGAPARRPVVVVPLDPFERSPRDQLVQRFEVVAPFAAVAAGAPKAYFFELPGPATVTPDGAVLPVPALGRGATYETTSGRAPATPSMLRASDADRDRAPAPDAWLAAPGLSERARALAARVTAPAPASYDKVRALEAWLARHVEVDDDAAPLPPGADLVDTVVFADRAGTPQRLATTLAVLARAAGVPARVATGFLPGDRPLLGGDFVVRARHAHTWVEVPFPGLGWQRFDATGRIAAAEGGDSWLSRLRRLLSRNWMVLVGVLVVLAAGVARWLLLRRRTRLAVPWATRYFERLTRLGAKRGRPRARSETPDEYAAALADGVLGDERLRQVGHVVTAAAWSRREPPEEVRLWAEDVLRAAACARARSTEAV